MRGRVKVKKTNAYPVINLALSLGATAGPTLIAAKVKSTSHYHRDVMNVMHVKEAPIALPQVTLHGS